ncbi:MAG: hypothetical protein QW416_03910 [Candidatus Nitrosocaldaceae archaeon]
MQLQFDEFMNKKVYDMVIKCASNARDLDKKDKDNKDKKLDKTTVSNMLEIFQGNAISATLTLMIYIKRQEKRREIPHNVASSLFNDLASIYNSFSSEEEKLSKAVYKYLLLFKWAFECEITQRVNTFDEFIKISKGA